jgi:hypothetical protein
LLLCLSSELSLNLLSIGDFLSFLPPLIALHQLPQTSSVQIIRDIINSFVRFQQRRRYIFAIR